jgi:hypothetical protein
VCNACAVASVDYRVVVVFLHGTAAVRAYCPRCYPAAADGDYHAAGDGMLLDYAAFAARFGPAGPPPPPATPVDRLLTALIRDPALRRLTPASEAVARRRRAVPNPVRVTMHLDGALVEAQMTISALGAIVALAGDAAACARVRESAAGA